MRLAVVETSATLAKQQWVPVSKIAPIDSIAVASNSTTQIFEATIGKPVQPVSLPLSGNAVGALQMVNVVEVLEMQNAPTEKARGYITAESEQHSPWHCRYGQGLFL